MEVHEPEKGEYYGMDYDFSSSEQCWNDSSQAAYPLLVSLSLLLLFGSIHRICLLTVPLQVIVG